MYWNKQYILFHNEQQPKDMGKQEIEQFLNYLVNNRHLSASSQSQALNALLFMYKQVLEIEPGWLDKLERAKRKITLPVVLSVREVQMILDKMNGIPKLMAELIYGTGMQVNECTQLRIKDIDFDLKTITIRHGKGGKDRSTILPEKLIIPLEHHLLKIIEQHRKDCLMGAGYVPLPGALYKKYPKAAQAIGWQYVFPSAIIRVYPKTSKKVRWHCSASTPQRAFKQALNQTGIVKQTVSIRFAIALPRTFYKMVWIRRIQTLLGHKNINTTMIYTHIIKRSKTPEVLLTFYKIGSKKMGHFNKPTDN